MNALTDWASQWGVSQAALADLVRRLCPPPTEQLPGALESSVQQHVRLANARQGVLLWRNNVGVLKDERGVPVRYGLANDSKAVNERIKSGDLIGIRPVLITADHVGQTIGQFVSRECKRAGWRWAATPREVAQLQWATIINQKGGDAQIVSG